MRCRVRAGRGAAAVGLAAALLAALAACSLDYDQARLATEISPDTPDTILHDVIHTVVRDGRPRFVVRAERSESYRERRRQYLYHVEFLELDAEGETATYGVADSGEYKTDTEDIDLTGGLRFYSAVEDAWLTAERLSWKNDTRTLTSLPDETVILERGDGTEIRGRGFVAEMARSMLRFEDGVSGTLIEEDNPQE